MFLYGRNSVLERLKSNPQSIKRIYLLKGFKEPQIENLIKSRNIPVAQLNEKEISRIKRADNLQGIIAETNKFEYFPFGGLLEAKNRNRTLIFLDSLSDPQNLGSVIRTLACMGGFAVVIPKHNSCEINETVLHVASGGENFVPVSIVTNLSTALIEAKKAGYWIVGAVVKGGSDINQTKLPFPVCLVLGSEGRGLRYGIEKQLELKLSLPMKGAGLSFNVAVACAIFSYEINKQRQG